jgi:hypothetical protein
MVDLRRRTDDVQRAYQATTLETQKLRIANKISAEEYTKRMYDARKLRSESLVSIQKERYALEDAQHAIQDEYHKTLQDARKLHLEQQKQLRGEINATQDEIALHKQRIAQIHERQAALKEHGHMLMQNGASAMYTGTAMFTMGVIGELAYKKMVDAAISYKQAAATTLTQIDDTGVKLKDIEKIGIEVGNKIPVAFEQLQPALYDIFSSINVGTKDAHKLLEQFAKDAVAGQTDMETATRANIAIMNAYKIKVKDASQVSDFMFRLVQKGVGNGDDERVEPWRKCAQWFQHELNRPFFEVEWSGDLSAVGSTKYGNDDLCWHAFCRRHICCLLSLDAFDDGFRTIIVVLDGRVHDCVDRLLERTNSSVDDI